MLGRNIYISVFILSILRKLTLMLLPMVSNSSPSFWFLHAIFWSFVVSPFNYNFVWHQILRRLMNDKFQCFLNAHILRCGWKMCANSFCIANWIEWTINMVTKNGSNEILYARQIEYLPNARHFISLNLNFRTKKENRLQIMSKLSRNWSLHLFMAWLSVVFMHGSI